MQIRIDLPETIAKQVKGYEALYGMPHNEFISFALADFILRKGPLEMTPEEFVQRLIAEGPIEEAKLKKVLEGTEGKEQSQM